MKYPLPGRLQQVHVGIPSKGFVSVASEFENDLYEEEHQTLQASLLRLCPSHLWYHGSHATSCPRPILVTPEHQDQLLALHTALAAAIQSSPRCHVCQPKVPGLTTTVCYGEGHHY